MADSSFAKLSVDAHKTRRLIKSNLPPVIKKEYCCSKSWISEMYKHINKCTCYLLEYVVLGKQ